MAVSSYSKLVGYLEAVFLAILIMQCCICVAGTLIALLGSDDDCENPVRVWLIVYSAVSGGLILVYLNWKIVGFGAWCLWNVVWAVVGAVWVFGDENCQDRFDYGYAAAGVIVCTSLFMLAGVVVVSCIGGIGACVGYGLMSNYEELE